MKTIEAEGLPEERIGCLEELIRQWRAEEQRHPEKRHDGEEQDIKPSDFIVKNSHIIGELTRAAAYEDN